MTKSSMLGDPNWSTDDGKKNSFVDFQRESRLSTDKDVFRNDTL